MSGPDEERVEERLADEERREEAVEQVEERGEEAAEGGDCGCLKRDPTWGGDPRVGRPVPNLGRRPV